MYAAVTRPNELDQSMQGISDGENPLLKPPNNVQVTASSENKPTMLTLPDFEYSHQENLKKVLRIYGRRTRKKPEFQRVVMRNQGINKSVSVDPNKGI